MVVVNELSIFRPTRRSNGPRFIYPFCPFLCLEVEQQKFFKNLRTYRPNIDDQETSEGRTGFQNAGIVETSLEY